MKARERPDTENDSEVNQPGLRELREAVANRLSGQLPSRSSLQEDALAGLNSAVSSVPDGMASEILVGVNPIYGLYACMVGPIAGGIFSSTRLMIIATTSAASLSAGQALGGLSGESRDSALFLMVVLIGGFQILLGLLGAGRLTRFVSYSVMTGFIIGIALLTILSQFPTISGFEPTEGGNKVTQAAEVVYNFRRLDPWSLGAAGLTLALAILLPRTKLGNFGRLVAIIATSVFVYVLQLKDVQVVRDVGSIPEGFPLPHLPSLSTMSVDVATGALAVAVVVLVQGAGVSQSVRIPAVVDGACRATS